VGLATALEGKFCSTTGCCNFYLCLGALAVLPFSDSTAGGSMWTEVGLLCAVTTGSCARMSVLTRLVMSLSVVKSIYCIGSEVAYMYDVSSKSSIRAVRLCFEGVEIHDIVSVS
jgi:hypothetical protein